MKVLFIGGTGLISQAASQLAAERGIELFLLNRGNNSMFIPDGVNKITGDIRKPNDIRDILHKYHFDTVVDWIAFTPQHIQTDIQLFREITDQYVFISSASIYQKPLSHYLVTESTPTANPYWQYSRDKIACEELLNRQHRETGFPVTIVRPSFTYGDTMIPAALSSWHHPWSLVDRMLKGKKIVVHGDGSALWTMTHNTDFAKGFIGLLGNMQAIGHAFHITSDEVLTWDQIYNAIGHAAGVKPKLVHIASDYIVSRLPDSKGTLLGDKAVSCVFDNSKIKRFVPEFRATVPFSEGIKRTIDWYKAHPSRCTIDMEWNTTMDSLIEGYESGR